MSQTLKALVRKGFIAEQEDSADKRSISYVLTASGHQAVCSSSPLVQAIEALPDTARGQMIQGLQQVLRPAIASNAHKSFGICRACQHFRPRTSGGFCNLLALDLTQSETHQICHEHDPA